MLINKQNVRKAFNSGGKRVSAEALEILDHKIHNIITKAIANANCMKTVKGSDVALVQIKGHGS